MAEKSYSQHDLELAKELGALSKAIYNMAEKLDKIVTDKDTQHTAIWTRIDSHSQKISDQNAAIRWIVGIGTGISTALGTAMYWIKHQ